MSDEGGHSPGGLACSTVWALGDFHGWEALQKIPELSQKHRRTFQLPWGYIKLLPPDLLAI
uniref:Uncharacterized protein n=1 Tax=Oryza barthii TaxID=65489 RepID=A0A0D3HIF7_9ORYZ